MGKDWKKWEMTNIRHSESFWTTLVGKDWKKCEMTKIRHSESSWITLVVKDWKKCKMTIIGVLNYFGPLWWEKIGKERSRMTKFWCSE